MTYQPKLASQREKKFSDDELDAAYLLWNDLGIDGRVNLCRRAGVSIFAARNWDQIPASAYIWDYLTAEED